MTMAKNTHFPTSFALPKAELDALEKLKLLTGVNKNTMVQRLIAAYAAGLAMPGLPTVAPADLRATKVRS